MSDPINHPAHYTSSPAKCECGRTIECIDITEHMSFPLGNTVKYVWRADLKHDDGGLEDLRKAAWYLQREINRRSAANAPTPATTPDPETNPAEAPSRASQDGLRVGARVRVKQRPNRTTTPHPGKEGDIVEFHNPAHPVVRLDSGARFVYRADELEVIA
ncbi:DUF3310 domain-containing protein [Pseudarthrobacter phenanthrenivorans]|uniref:DUF3310 domain-containing protein n=1 Tax=Pseudarthrobacter phenanthrenivorans TaxID=361575 RepID=UPI0034503E96